MDKAIKDLDIYISDGNYSSKYPRSEEFVDEGVPFIRANNLVDGDISDEDMYFITSEKHSVLLKGHVKSGDVLITTRGNIGQVAVVPDKHEDSNINAQIVLLRANHESIYNRYLLWALQSRKAKEQYETLQTGTALKQLPVGKLEQLRIKVIGIEEQHKVARNLDKIYQLIKARQEELVLLDELIKARFIELFGDSEKNSKNWPMYKLDELCDVGSSKRIYQEEQTLEGIPFWRISDLVNKMDTGYANSGLYISQEKYDELEEKGQVPVAGDILVTSRGTLGRCYIISETDKFYFQDGMISWLSKYKHGITPLYIKHLFMTSGLIRQINGMQAGSTVAYLSIAMLKKLDIMLPDPGVQLQFEEFVKQIDKSKFIEYIVA